MKKHFTSLFLSAAALTFGVVSPAFATDGGEEEKMPIKKRGGNYTKERLEAFKRRVEEGKKQAAQTSSASNMTPQDPKEKDFNWILMNTFKHSDSLKLLIWSYKLENRQEPNLQEIMKALSATFLVGEEGNEENILKTLRANAHLLDDEDTRKTNDLIQEMVPRFEEMKKNEAKLNKTIPRFPLECLKEKTKLLDEVCGKYRRLGEAAASLGEVDEEAITFLKETEIYSRMALIFAQTLQLEDLKIPRNNARIRVIFPGFQHAVLIMNVFRKKYELARSQAPWAQKLQASFEKRESLKTPKASGELDAFLKKCGETREQVKKNMEKREAQEEDPLFLDRLLSPQSVFTNQFTHRQSPNLILWAIPFIDSQKKNVQMIHKALVVAFDCWEGLKREKLFGFLEQATRSSAGAKKEIDAFLTSSRKILKEVEADEKTWKKEPRSILSAEKLGKEINNLDAQLKAHMINRKAMEGIGKNLKAGGRFEGYIKTNFDAFMGAQKKVMTWLDMELIFNKVLMGMDENLLRTKIILEGKEQAQKVKTHQSLLMLQAQSKLTQGLQGS